MSERRLIWIDLVRGFCMLAILIHHTEMYYVGKAIIDYRLYVDNALCIFFFISGYLFYKESNFNIKYKLIAIFKSIIIPYFTFMSVIALPKAMVHGTFISLSDSLLNIILGKESWFITALATAEILFSILISWSKRYKPILPIGVFVSLITIILLTGNEKLLSNNYWNIMDGLLAISFLYIGFLYHQNEDSINSIPQWSYFILFILFLISKCIIIEYETYCFLGPVNIDNYPVFLVDNLLAIILIVRLSKLLPDIKPISWMGSHVIVYYFLCGGIPLILSSIANKIGFTYQGIYLQVIFIICLVYIIITIITWFIYRYLPWATGRYNN